jgi:plasmid maintenance system antidote protein VapI
MNLQLRYDLYETERAERGVLKDIEPCHQAG